MSFPQAQIKGCFFQLKQAWYKKILKLGLSSKYKNPSSEEGQWLKKIFDLPFSPSNEIGDIFFALNLWRLNQIMTFLPNFVTIW
jgi:hypothetical protein